MICIGMDVSKEKSTVCAMEATGKLLLPPFDVPHTLPDMQALCSRLKALPGPVRIVMEATGHYHLPPCLILAEEGFFVCVENAMLIKRFGGIELHGGKTDPLDAKKIARYGLNAWERLKPYQIKEGIYAELKVLLSQYFYVMKHYTLAKINLTNGMDQTMPGVKKLLSSSSYTDFRKIKYKDFAAEYGHFETIRAMGKTQFLASYRSWCQKERYQYSQEKACKLFHLAETGIPTLPPKPDIIDAVVRMAARHITDYGEDLNHILSQMTELAKQLPEYEEVQRMSGTGKKLCPCLIAAIGDVRRFYSGKALVAYAGVDTPPYQSGQFTGTRRKISKRGDPKLRKVGYEVMLSLKSHPPTKDTAVYEFIKKKEGEGKPKKVANIAGLNKFLRIYYARVTEVYRNQEIRKEG